MFAIKANRDDLVRALSVEGIDRVSLKMQMGAMLDVSRVNIQADQVQHDSGGAGGLTDDGRYVLVGSPSTNLTDDGDVDDRLLDVFMHDMWTGERWRISNSTNGEEGNAQSEAPSMSANGMVVAFASNATNLAPNDTNGFKDIFVHINARLRK